MWQGDWNGWGSGGKSFGKGRDYGWNSGKGMRHSMPSEPYSHGFKGKGGKGKGHWKGGKGFDVFPQQFPTPHVPPRQLPAGVPQVPGFQNGQSQNHWVNQAPAVPLPRMDPGGGSQSPPDPSKPKWSFPSADETRRSTGMFCAPKSASLIPPPQPQPAVPRPLPYSGDSGWGTVTPQNPAGNTATQEPSAAKGLEENIM